MDIHLTAVVRNVLEVFAALLPIVNPLGMAPIFAEMTLGYAEAIRRTVAMRVAINGILLLVHHCSSDRMFCSSLA